MDPSVLRNRMGTVGALAGALIGLVLWMILFPYLAVLDRLVPYASAALATVFSLTGCRIGFGKMPNRAFFLAPVCGGVASLIGIYYTYVKDIQVDMLNTYFITDLSFKEAFTISYESLNATALGAMGLDLVICLLTAAVLSFLVWLFWPDGKPTPADPG